MSIVYQVRCQKLLANKCIYNYCLAVLYSFSSMYQNLGSVIVRISSVIFLLNIFLVLAEWKELPKDYNLNRAI